jgi:hypothetical protein
MKHMIIALIFVIALFLSCFPKRITDVFTDPHFYYDEEHYTLIRVNPETRDEDIKRFDERTEKKIFKDYPLRPKPDTLGFDLPPRPKKIVAPKYPRDLLKQGYSGKVFLQLLVNEQGIVVLAKPASGIQNLDEIGNEFVKVSLEAAIQTEFYPALHEDNPVKVWVTYPIQFVITN